MLCQSEPHSILSGSLLPQSTDIFVRSHLHGIEPVDSGIIVEKVVVMGGLRHKIPCSRIVIQLHQFFRTEIFRLPECTDILVSESGRMAVGPDVIIVLRASLNIHVPRVPVSEHRYTLRPPVAPDSKLRVPEPFGTLKLSE